MHSVVTTNYHRSWVFTQTTRPITCITFMLRTDLTLCRFCFPVRIKYVTGSARIMEILGVGWGGGSHNDNNNNNTDSNNQWHADDCTESTYRRFRKLTLDVKLVLKLEKFSVPAFSCNDIRCVRLLRRKPKRVIAKHSPGGRKYARTQRWRLH